MRQRQQRGAWRLQELEEEELVLPVSISAPTRLPGLVELEPVGEGEALALAPPVVQAPPGVAVGADDHLPAGALGGHGHAQPLVRPDLVVAGLAAGPGHDPTDGVAVRGALGQRALPDTAGPGMLRTKLAKYPRW